MKNITLKFSVEIDGETFAKVAKCIKDYEPEIFSKMHEQFKPQFDKILNEGIRESGKEFCQCENPHHASTTNGDVICTICGKFYWHNSLERT